MFLQYTTTLFVEELQKILDQPLCLEQEQSYLDLSLTRDILPELFQEQEKLPPADPLVQALAIILRTMESGPFEFTKLGINELLKSYLRRVKQENEEACTRCYLNCVYQLYLYGLLERYPYTDLFWEYLSLCFDTVSKYLIENKLVAGCQVFLNKVAIMGKWAAQKNLHTSSIQNFLHNMEIWARAEGFYELADNAKNNRFNLEAL